SAHKMLTWHSRESRITPVRDTQNTTEERCMPDYLLEHRVIPDSARSCDTLTKKEIHGENLGSIGWSGGDCQGNVGDLPGNDESHAHRRLSRSSGEISGTFSRRA